MSSDHALPPLEALLAHRAWVRFLARRLANEAVDADDLEQDAWLAAAAALPHDGVGIRAWFARVVRNRAAERRRLDVHRRAREAVVARDEVAGTGADLVADAEALTRVVQAVLALDEPYRETVLLRFYEGLPPREVAARMHVPVDTVRTRLRRAAELLREALGGRRDDWLAALAPLLDLRRGALLPTATAVAGGIAMKLSTKVVIAALALAAAAGLAVRYRADDASPGRSASVPATASRTEAARDRRSPARPSPFDIAGTTTSAGAPASAHVVGQRIGAPRDLDAWTRSRVQTLAVPPAAAADAEADSDATGAFVLGRLASGSFRVLATFADGRCAVAIVDVTEEAPHARVVLAAPEGGSSLHGRAVHADGSPFTGWIRLHQTIIEASRWTRTDAKGTFVFAGLAPVKTFLLATDEGATWSASATVQIPFEGEYVLPVDQKAASRRGRVVAAADEAPVARATVKVQTGTFDGVLYETTLTSKQDGVFEGRWSGRAALFASAKGFVKAVSQDDGRAGDVVVRLTRSSVVAGRVLRRDDGAPVVGAVVRANPAADKSWGNETTTRSGEDGGFRLEDVPPGDVDVFVLGGGWASADAALARRGAFDPFVVHVEPGATATVELRAEAAASAKGRVFDADGAPAAGLSVGALPTTYFDGFAWRIASAAVRADGTFAIDGLLPDLDYTFSARQDAYGVLKQSEPVRTVGGKTVEVSLQLDRPRRLDVTVLDDVTGAPLAGAVVSICRGRQPPDGSWATDATGRVSISPALGDRIAVRAKAKGHAPSPQDVTVEEVDATHLVATVRLAAGKVVSGRVVAPDGTPMDAVYVSLRPDTELRTGPSRSLTTWDYRNLRSLPADGGFRFDDLEDGAYVLDASVVDGEWRGTAKARAGDMNVVVAAVADPEPKGDRLRIRVFDADGRVVPDAKLKYLHVCDVQATDGSNAWHKQAMELMDATPVRDGAATIVVRCERVGERWIAVYPSPTRTGAPPSGAVVVPVPYPLPAELEIRLPAERRIAGRVLGPDGVGLAGVRVTAQAAATSSFEWFMMVGAQEQAAATTRADGAFDFGGLGDFTYRLSFAAPAGLAPATPMKVTAGTSGVEVRLVRGAQPVVTVLDTSGRPLEGCVVSVREVTGSTPTNSLSARTGADGKAKVPPLNATVAYELSVSPPEGRDDLLHSWQQTWTPADVEIRLEPAFAVAGIVRDATGTPLAGATVSFRRGKAGWGKALSGDDGRFRIGGLRARETVRLRAAARGDVEHDDRVEGDALEATAGDENVALVADAGATLQIRVVGVPAGVAANYRLFSTSGARSRGSVGRSGDDRVPADGALRLAGLDPAAKYRVFIGPTEDGLYGLSDDISPGGGEVVVRLVQGEVLAGRVRLPDGVAAREVGLFASGLGWSARAAVDAEGRFRFPGVPPHATRLDAFVYRQGKNVFRGTCATPAGTDVVVELSPEQGGK